MRNTHSKAQAALTLLAHGLSMDEISSRLQTPKNTLCSLINQHVKHNQFEIVCDPSDTFPPGGIFDGLDIQISARAGVWPVGIVFRESTNLWTIINYGSKQRLQWKGTRGDNKQ